MLIVSRSDGNFNHSNVCWENNTMGCKQPRKFLESAEDKFLVQVLNKSTRAEVLDLVLSSVEGIIKEVKTESGL